MKSRHRDSRATAATGQGAESAGKAWQRQAQTKPKPQDTPASSEGKPTPPPKQERQH
jgi:hypothetical protein